MGLTPELVAGCWVGGEDRLSGGGARGGASVADYRIRGGVLATLHGEQFATELSGYTGGQQRPLEPFPAAGVR